MKVESLMQAIELRDDKSHNTLLGDLEVSADCSSLRLKSSSIEFPWDEQAERAVAQYLSIPKTYLHKCEPEFRAHTVNHWIAAAEGAETTVEYMVRDDENALIALQRPDRPVLPLSSVAEIVTRCFDPQDEVIQLLRDEAKFHLDVATSHSVEVPPVESLPDRRVGDITRGGVRIMATPHKSTPPVVQGYFHRLACTNGMTDDREEGTIRLKGRTAEELIEELEVAAQRVLGTMQERLNAYAATATKRVPGNPAAFAFRIAQETGLSNGVTERIMSRAGALPVDDENVSIYDIVNIFTEVAQSGTKDIKYGTRVKMQEVAGAMTFSPETTVQNRCNMGFPHL